MYSAEQINKLSMLIAKTIKPNKVILFGSYAYGKPTLNSDVDLMVLMDDQDMSIEKKIEIKLKIMEQRRKTKWINSDICILSKSDYEARKDDLDSAIYEATRKGQIIYDKSIEKGGTL